MTTEIRIGVIVPKGNSIHENEFMRLGSKGVQFRFTSFSYPRFNNTDFCGDLSAEMSAPIAELRAWGAEAILIGCTTASMVCGSQQWRENLERLANAPVVTAAEASLQAIGALGVTSIAVATPYGDAGNQTVNNFLVENGLTVATIKGLGLDSSIERWLKESPMLSAKEVLDFSVTVDSALAETIYLPCVGIGSLDVLDPLEKRTGKPALSSVQAGYWSILRRMGANGRAKGYGRLIEVWDF
jgi:maleate cis-trans isomerase